MAKTINPHQQHLSLTHGTPGSVYVLHLEPAYKHARHYIGWTSQDDVTDRIAVHLQGHGSPLIRAAINAGVDVQLTTTYSGTRALQRCLRRRHNTSQLCTSAATNPAAAPVNASTAPCPQRAHLLQKLPPTPAHDAAAPP